MTRRRERDPVVVMWVVVVAAFVVAMGSHGVTRAVAAYILVWWMLALTVLGFTETDPTMITPVEAAIQHVGPKILGTAVVAVVVVVPPAWWLLAS